MATATQQQAREYRAQQAAIAAGGAAAVRRLLAAGADWGDLLTTVAAAQLSAAALAVATVALRAERAPLVTPGRFAGVSAFGFPISEPIIATIDARVPAPVEALPQQWWDSSAVFSAAVEQLVASEVQDTARSAGQAEMVTQGATRYVRVLAPPSCKRCAVLAGRLYRTDKPFARHPGCDCTSEAVSSLEDAVERGLVVTPDDAYRRGWIRDLTAGERAAIDDGADIGQVINSASGIATATIAGQRLKTTRYGSTRRAAWRRANPSLRVRLRPEAIYDIANGDRAEAIRLLGVYGYLTP